MIKPSGIDWRFLRRIGVIVAAQAALYVGILALAWRDLVRQDSAGAFPVDADSLGIPLAIVLFFLFAAANLLTIWWVARRRRRVGAVQRTPEWERASEGGVGSGRSARRSGCRAGQGEMRLAPTARQLTYAAADGRFRHQVVRRASGILRAGIPSVNIKPPAAELGR